MMLQGVPETSIGQSGQLLDLYRQKVPSSRNLETESKHRRAPKHTYAKGWHCPFDRFV